MFRAISQSLFICFSMVCLSASASPIKHLNFSVWTEYTGMNFNNLTQEERSEKLQRLFKDQLCFVKKHHIRRLIVLIPDPSEFDFFHKEHFDLESPDNFLYWASEFNKVSGLDVEALFNTQPFYTNAQTCLEMFYLYKDPAFGNFENFYNKLQWVSDINQERLLIKGIVLDAREEPEMICQNLINTLDQYQSNANQEIPFNPEPSIKRAMVFNLDQKHLALPNLARFPLTKDLKGDSDSLLGLSLPETFPSCQEEQFPSPSWRPATTQALLDTVYLRMDDTRLVPHIYQNSRLLPHPHNENHHGVDAIVKDLVNILRKKPCCKAPGTVSLSKGSAILNGKHTFFKSGTPKNEHGKLNTGQALEIHVPGLHEPIRRTVKHLPSTNRLLELNRPVSLDISEASYFYNPLNITWSFPKISHTLRDKLYFVFSVGSNTPQPTYFENWHFSNFLRFIYHTPRHGFCRALLFQDFSNRPLTVTSNLVLYDYTTIPNGSLYCDWNLGNQQH